MLLNREKRRKVRSSCRQAAALGRRNALEQEFPFSLFLSLVDIRGEKKNEKSIVSQRWEKSPNKLLPSETFKGEFQLNLEHKRWKHKRIFRVKLTHISLGYENILAH